MMPSRLSAADFTCLRSRWRPPRSGLSPPSVCVEHQLGHAEDGVHRRANLVADIGVGKSSLARFAASAASLD